MEGKGEALAGLPKADWGVQNIASSSFPLFQPEIHFRLDYGGITQFLVAKRMRADVSPVLQTEGSVISITENPYKHDTITTLHKYYSRIMLECCNATPI